MKLRLGEIRQMKDPMTVILDKDLPIKSAWRLNKLIKVFDKELADIEEFRISLVKRLGEVDEEGNVQVPSDKMEDFVTEFNELLSTEVEFEFEPIEIDSIGDINVTAKDLMILEKIFV